MRYDTTLKELLQDGTPQLWQELVGQSVKEYLTVELPSVQMRKPDFLARLDNGALFHLELQGSNETNMAWRELEYYLLIHRLYQQPPLQYVIYFGESPLKMSNSLMLESLQFRYNLIDIRSLKSQTFLASAALADNTLAILCGEKVDPDVIHRISQKFSSLPHKQKQNWFERLMILSGIRSAENIVREEAIKMGISLDIRDNKFFQEAYTAGIEDGVEQGIERGIERGETLALRRLIEHRFGTITDPVELQLNKLSRPEIEAAILRVLDAKQIEDVFAATHN